MLTFLILLFVIGLAGVLVYWWATLVAGAGVDTSAENLEDAEMSGAALADDARAENFDDDEEDDIFDATHDDEDPEYYGEDLADAEYARDELDDDRDDERY